MKIYRAMCEAEAEKTISNGRPHFIGRHKWFSDDLGFIVSRVQDGKFNNSQHKPERYTRLFEFETDDINKSRRVSDHEIQFDKKNNPKILLVGEIVLDKYIYRGTIGT